ncbi:MAG TPA: hypothetical protein VIB48_15130 [Acidimicrobiia bacterium]|jgi:hypothetical protein
MDDLDLGRPGLSERLARAGASWFMEMRNGLPGAAPSQELAAMIGAAGLEVVDSRVVRLRFDPPLPDRARRLPLASLHRARTQFAQFLDEDDRDALRVLVDETDPSGAAQRRSLCVAASRQIVIARPQ